MDVLWHIQVILRSHSVVPNNISPVSGFGDKKTGDLVKTGCKQELKSSSIRIKLVLFDGAVLYGNPEFIIDLNSPS